MITVKFKYDFPTQARTLSVEYLGYNKQSGWLIDGTYNEDYYEWVSDFCATHPVYGKVEGNFETTVTADTQEAYDHFTEHHHYEEWDYWDI